MASTNGDRLDKEGDTMQRVTLRVPDELLAAVDASEFPNRSAAIRAGMRAVVAGEIATGGPVERVLGEVDAVADNHGVDPDDLTKAVLAQVRKRGDGDV